MLGVYNKDEAFKGSAKKALLAAATPAIINHYVEFTVVGNAADPAARALFAAGQAQYEPRKALRYEKSGRYPQTERPAMYICNPSSCSVAIFDAEKVAKYAAAFVNKI